MENVGYPLAFVNGCLEISGTVVRTLFPFVVV
jgi:hypothetical protein